MAARVAAIHVLNPGAEQDVDGQAKPGHDGCGSVVAEYHPLMQKGGWVYIMTNRRDGTLYCGVTSDLARRGWQHREGLIEGFTKAYGLKRLAWYEHFPDIRDAISARRPSNTGPAPGRSASSTA